MRRTDLSTIAALLGLAACSASAGYVLDEESTVVADATPTARPHRIAWRVTIVAIPALVALAGLLSLNVVDPPTHWLRLVPFGAVTLAIGVALAAVLRRNGSAEPGDLAGVLAVSGVVLLVVINPLSRYVAVLPLGGDPHPGRSAVLASAVIAAGGAITLVCARDPGQCR